MMTQKPQEAPRFLRSTNLEQDHDDPTALNGYVVSQVAQQTLTRILKDLAKEDGNRSWTLVGPYGTGKSSFLVFLAWMLSATERSKIAEKRLRQDWSFEADRCMDRLQAITGGMETVLVTGHRGPLALALLQGLDVTARRLFPGAPICAKIQSTIASFQSGESVDQVISSLFLEVAQQTQQLSPKRAGLLVVVDELGKFLEFAASRGNIGDVFILQQLAEMAPRAGSARIALLTVLHQDFDAYATNLPTAARNEWTKIRGRFESIAFMESTEHLLMLVAGGVAASGYRRQETLFSPQTTETLDLSCLRGLGNQQRKLLNTCLPLNPVAALALGPLFRQGFGQNERSIFAFLLSKEPFGFQEFIEDKKRRYYCIDDLYDYLRMTANTQGRGATARVWALAETAFSRLPKNTEALDIRLIKAICLMSFLDNSFGVHADKSILALALDESEAKIDASIRRLQNASVIVYRRFKSAYELWAGSDLDVDDIIATMLRAVRAEGGYASLLQTQLPPAPVIAARHYFQTGTLRHLNARYVTYEEAFQNTTMDAGDGELRLVIPDRIEDLEEIIPRLLQSGPREKRRPIVVALPATPRELLAHIEDWRAVQRALKETPALDQDSVAKRELEEQVRHATEQLIQSLARAFGSQRQGTSVRWFYNEKELRVAGRPSAAASDLFDSAYNRSPKIRNELINRAELSTAASAARKTLVEKLFQHADKEALGIEGSPPEKSMYLSVLYNTGMHRQEGGRWGLYRSNSSDSGMSILWDRLNERVIKGNKQHSLSEILEWMGTPPFGIRQGLSLLLLIIWMIQNQNRVFFYEDGSFVPLLNAEVLHQMLRHPSNFKIQINVPEEATGRTLEKVAEDFGLPLNKGNIVLTLTRALVRQVRSLSTYAATTNQISGAARKVRSAITGARDPMQLLTQELPELLDANITDVVAYSTALKSAVKELQGADNALLSRLENTLRGLFHQPGPAFYADIKEKGERLAKLSELPSIVKKFVQLVSGLDPKDEESRRIWMISMATGLVGKQPTNWNDSDESRFAVAAMELYRSLSATEQLAMERRTQGSEAVHLIRVSVLDSDGQDRSGVAVLRQEDNTRIQLFRQQVVKLAAESGIQQKELAYAVIASMLEFFQETPGMKP